jgi:hypothetical protein
MKRRTALAWLGSSALLPGQSDEPGFILRRLMPPIRPITDAPAIRADEVSGQVRGEELVIGVVVNTHARAYPVNMLTGPQREIINDQLGGKSIAATW